jgi:hypothetical protein
MEEISMLLPTHQSHRLAYFQKKYTVNLCSELVVSSAVAAKPIPRKRKLGAELATSTYLGSERRAI